MTESTAEPEPPDAPDKATLDFIASVNRRTEKIVAEAPVFRPWNSAAVEDELGRDYRMQTHSVMELKAQETREEMTAQWGGRDGNHYLGEAPRRKRE